MATEADLSWLRSEWTQLFSSLGADAEASRQAFAELVEQYSSPGRYYHTLAHIQHVLQTIHTLKAEARDLPAVLLAGWYHDVIYDSKAKDNEEQSAAYAAEALERLGIDEERVRHVGALVLMTKTHEARPWDDADAHVLLDADLAILGAPTHEYDDYAAAIQREYVWVPRHDYCHNRLAVLGKFQIRGNYYRTETMRRSRERRAGQNLSREMARLRDEIGGHKMEAEWLASADTSHLHDVLENFGIDSERKFRLLACAHCRGFWQLLPDQRCREAVEAAERVADGLLTEAELRPYYEAAHAVNRELTADASWARNPELIRQVKATWKVFWAARHAGIDPWLAARQQTSLLLDAAPDVELLPSAATIREIFGNPFRPVMANPAWQSANASGLAQTIYEERAFERMPILADALEDAGCDNADILEHCRQPGEHVRGCWVVDLILGKS